MTIQSDMIGVIHHPRAPREGGWSAWPKELRGSGGLGDDVPSDLIHVEGLQLGEGARHVLIGTPREHEAQGHRMEGLIEESSGQAHVDDVQVLSCNVDRDTRDDVG